MDTTTTRRTWALLASVALLASLAVASIAAPASAANPTCMGKVPTIVGTSEADVIVGTRKADVIVAMGGNDVIRGRGGADSICGGGGDDTLYGQGGSDHLHGGPRWDHCWQGPGTGKLVDCERPLPPLPPAPPADAQILAVAYSDLDGDHAFGAGDLLISKLVDTNDDEKPSKGDTVVMGQYPADTAASTFGRWGRTLHAVKSVRRIGLSLTVETPTGYFRFIAGSDESEAERFSERYYGVLSESLIQDGFNYVPNVVAADCVRLHVRSPSQPGLSLVECVPGQSPDDRFIDVDVLY